MYVTQGGPARASLGDLTHSQCETEAHTFWLIISHDVRALGQLADVSTALSCLEKG